MTFDMVIMLMGWLYDSFDCPLSCILLRLYKTNENKTKVIRADLLDFDYDLDFDLRTFLDCVTFQFW